MKKVIKVKRQAVPADSIEGCVLVPLNQRKPHYPLVQSNVLPNTYYRVVKDEDRVRALVTVMPDGSKVAWDSCAKCYGHVTLCACKDGMYHSRSISWIRATCDVNYPSERVTDYSMYYDPFMRKEGRTDIRVSIGRSPADVPSSTPRRKSKAVDPEPLPPVKEAKVKPRKAKPGLTDADIENLDMAALNKAAAEQAKDVTRKVRRTIVRGGKK